MKQTWDLKRQREVVQCLDGFQQWTNRWSAQMEHFYEDWLDSMLLLESRSQFGIRLTDDEKEQLYEAIERAQLHDLLRQHVEHVQAYLERCRDRYGWNRKENDLSEAVTANMYPFVRAIDVLTSIVYRSIDRMTEELEHWQSTFSRWESDQELYKVWPEMDLRFADMHAILNDGRSQLVEVRKRVLEDMAEQNTDVKNEVDQAVLEELEPLMKRLRSVYERQFAAQVVNEFEMHVGAREGDVEIYEEPSEIAPSAGGYTYRFGDQLSIFSIKAEHRRLMEEISPFLAHAEGAFIGDISNVIDVDASGIQLLLSIAATCNEKGIGFQLTGSSDVLSHWLERAGAAALLK